MCSVDEDEAAPVAAELGLLSLESEWDSQSPAASLAPQTPVLEDARYAHVATCVRCTQHAAILLRERDAYCRGCFGGYFEHKFRAQLGKTRAIRRTDNVLIAYSGGLSSAVLVRLFADVFLANSAAHGTAHPTHADRTGRTGKTFAVHVDESVAVGRSDEERARLRDALDALAARTPSIPLSTVSIARAFELDGVRGGGAQGLVVECAAAEGSPDGFRICARSASSQSEASSEERARAFFASLSSLTAREDALRIFRWQLLCAEAVRLGCQVVVSGENASSLAVKMLAAIATGRGASLAQEVGFADDRFAANGVAVIRPLRAVLSKEVAFYARGCGAEAYVAPPREWATMAPSKASIRRLTEAFVAGLQAEFRSTENTVLATADKLATDRAGSRGRGQGSEEAAARCPLCSAPTSTAAAAAGAACDGAGASTAGCGDCACDGQNAGGGSCGTKAGGVVDVGVFLCYACRALLRDVKVDGGSELPPFAAERLREAQRAQRREKMRGEISDYLLEDEDPPT